jgi:alpha-mannosidase
MGDTIGYGLFLTSSYNVNATALLVFGNGDGGGGALAKTLENVGASISVL